MTKKEKELEEVKDILMKTQHINSFKDKMAREDFEQECVERIAQTCFKVKCEFRGKM